MIHKSPGHHDRAVERVARTFRWRGTGAGVGAGGHPQASAAGRWLDASIETRPNATGAAVNLRKTLLPLGPVVVFGASNFPFAYSTAGGDTASALAAGCTVIVKAHPAHPETSTLAAAAIDRAVLKLQLPKGVFGHVYGASFSVGEYLVKHPYVKAVGFTGSLPGGKQLFDWAQLRKDPIPVFAEMGESSFFVTGSAS